MLYTLSESVTDLLVFHSSRQRGFNQCAVNNGGCSHLCLAQPAYTSNEIVTYSCACPTHYILQNNTCTRKKCKILLSFFCSFLCVLAPMQFMIYSQRNLAVRLLPDTPDSPEAVLPIQGLKGVKAIDFDPIYHNLYWV